MIYGKPTDPADSQDDRPCLDGRGRPRIQVEAFPRSPAYPSRSATGLLREPSPLGRVFPYTERHVQAVWYDARLRPGVLHTAGYRSSFSPH